MIFGSSIMPIVVWTPNFLLFWVMELGVGSLPGMGIWLISSVVSLKFILVLLIIQYGLLVEKAPMWVQIFGISLGIKNLKLIGGI